MDVQVWPGGQPGQTIAIVSLVLSDDVKLPATVRIPVPGGGTIDWAGEIASADPSQDPTRTYEIRQGDGGPYVEFEVSQSRNAQIEVGAIPLSVSGDESTSQLTFVQSVPASITAFTVRLPSGMELVSLAPESKKDPETNADGEALYSLPSKRMKTGDSTTVKVTYREAALPDVASGPDSATVVLYALMGALVVAVVAFLVVLRNRRGA
ncbi:MAG: hypothetical protein FDZ75_03360 [Actinobacteria bacterium]|nr:MAG: hypothetical protein FDZ75_03360 [Actinomycetota bacterium]